MRIYSRTLSQMQSISRLVMYDLKKYHPHLYKKVEQRQNDNVFMILPLLEKGVKQGLIRNDLNFEIILWLLRSQFRALVDDGFFPAGKYSMNEFIQAIILTFIRGIATPLGNRRVDDIVEKLNEVI